MNIPSILLGGALVYLVLNKKKSTLTTSSVVSRPGYQIKNCNTFIIENDTQAAWYAFKEGMKHISEDQMLKSLFGGKDCVSQLKDKSEKNLKFAYDLWLFYFAGGLMENKLLFENVVIALSTMKQQFQQMGLDTSKWENEDNIKSIIAAYENGQSENY
jgi:hypothetical protein